jgi:hypothetical protein
MPNQPITEDLPSYIKLQKGQVAEMLFERIALANDFTIEYTGNQYRHPIQPSARRSKSGSVKLNGMYDFRLSLNGQSPTVTYKIEVKYRKKPVSSIKPPAGTDIVVLFTRNAGQVIIKASGVSAKTGRAQDFDLLTAIPPFRKRIKWKETVEPLLSQASALFDALDKIG